MPDLKTDITALRDPNNIKKAGMASSPYVLRRIFATDPMIQRLIKGGKNTLPLIKEEMSGSKSYSEITMAALAYIVEKIDASAAPEILKAAYTKAQEKPAGPFFVHMAAHAIRTGLKMPTKSKDIVYSKEELTETRRKLR